MESQQEKKKKQEEYEKYVKEITPTHNLGLQMLKAFITGGIICTIGQVILNTATNYFALDKQTAASWCSLILILASVILTGFNIYPGIVKWGGAGALVPITGFANSVCAPAIEFKKEGQVFGIGCKIFTIAGPVILYGVFTSWLLGLLYWLGKTFGIV
ncbi:MAG: SpoVA/SpoVAEb family sporulation membrane protein [Lachnospiraceae bacterium]|nr:SpoVA/SpoVAEb family sporulation membrane protein [Lachnospiraceae bacterium]